jgi:hypothetical protein
VLPLARGCVGDKGASSSALCVVVGGAGAAAAPGTPAVSYVVLSDGDAFTGTVTSAQLKEWLPGYKNLSQERGVEDLVAMLTCRVKGVCPQVARSGEVSAAISVPSRQDSTAAIFLGRRALQFFSRVCAPQTCAVHICNANARCSWQPTITPTHPSLSFCSSHSFTHSLIHPQQFKMIWRDTKSGTSLKFPVNLEPADANVAATTAVRAVAATVATMTERLDAATAARDTVRAECDVMQGELGSFAAAEVADRSLLIEEMQRRLNAEKVKLRAARTRVGAGDPLWAFEAETDEDEEEGKDEDKAGVGRGQRNDRDVDGDDDDDEEYNTSDEESEKKRSIGVAADGNETSVRSSSSHSAAAAVKRQAPPAVDDGAPAASLAKRSRHTAAAPVAAPPPSAAVAPTPMEEESEDEFL